MRTILLRLAMPALLLGISVPALAANPKVVSEKAVSVSGKVESRKEAGMLWYELNTGTGKPLLIGAVYAFTGSNGDCLENAKNSGSPVTISGKLTMYDNGTGGFEEADARCTAGPAGAAAPAASGKQLKLDDKLHTELLGDSRYKLADFMLNGTWKQVKANLSEDQYKQVLQDQRQWASQGRDAAASRYAASMPMVEAFIKAMQDRTEALAALVSVPPAAATFEMKNASITVSVQDKTLSIEGDAFRGQNTCTIEGKGAVGKGWITIENDMAKFYVLFTRKGAQVEYIEDQGCGAGVQFDGNYARK